MDGIWYWDMNVQQEDPGFWNKMSRIGHRIKDGESADAPRDTIARVRLESIGGYDVSHVTNIGIADAGRFEHIEGPPELLHIYSAG